MKADELRKRFDAALGQLGLHNQRRMAVGSDREGPNAGLTTCTVSLAELEKLAARAEHLVELERMVWEVSDVEGAGASGWTDAAILAALGRWAAAHDFSMVAHETAADVVRDHLGLNDQA